MAAETNFDLEKLKLERDRHEAAVRQRDEELRLKREEFEFSKRQAEASKRELLTPLSVTITVTVLTALGAILNSWNQGKQNREIEREKAYAVQALERQKQESSMIFEAIKTGNSKAAAQNLLFLSDAGLIKLTPQQLTALNAQKGTSPVPVLPRPADSEAYVSPQSSILKTIYNWKSAYEQGNADAYISNYAKDSRIIVDDLAISFEAYRRRMREQFSSGGLTDMFIDEPKVRIVGDHASVECILLFKRHGGIGDFYSRGVQSFKLRQTESGDWLIYEEHYKRQKAILNK